MTDFNNWNVPYADLNPAYRRRVAYFSMEFGIHQALKIYSGGLGFLAGSHMRSAFALRQNLFGVGILWRFGYYDQIRNDNGYMAAQFRKKFYTFLEDTELRFEVRIGDKDVKVKVLYLAPEVFSSAPLFLMTTDFHENEESLRKISYRLYNNDEYIRLSQYMLLGLGGAKLVEMLGGAEIYHMNEGHALGLTFYLYSKLKDKNAVRKQVVFTTHTPERAGNEEHNFNALERIGFFNGTNAEDARRLLHLEGDSLGFTQAALNMSKISNGVSKLHGEVANRMWGDLPGHCPIIAITNAQNKKFWADREFDKAFSNRDDAGMILLKKEMKSELFEEVANQTGKIFDKNKLTIVWARRFASYKRANLLLRHPDRFLEFINNPDYPVQMIWAGKPYPMDQEAIGIFDDLITFSKEKNNLAVLVGYEIHLSYLLKRGADVWLNTPRRPHEASGTSGMTAAMNGAVNVSVSDGWIPEFAKHGENAFITPVADHTSLSIPEIDEFDYNNMMRMLEEEVVPLYYDDPAAWLQVMKNSMRDIYPYFDSDRMADEYYQKLYLYESSENVEG